MNKKLIKKDANEIEVPIKKRHHRRNYNSYARYTHLVLKSVHPDLGISKKAMQIMDNFIRDIFERIAIEAGRLSRYNRGRLTSREIQTAVMLVLPREIANHARSEGVRAITVYSQAIMYPAV